MILSVKLRLLLNLSLDSMCGLRWTLFTDRYVLFVRDHKDYNKFHPRISAQFDFL